MELMEPNSVYSPAEESLITLQAPLKAELLSHFIISTWLEIMLH